MASRLLFSVCVLVFLSGHLYADGGNGKVTVFAAASLRGALDEVSKDFQIETGLAVAISYAGSSVLARQISQGAPADIFISANLAWMDWLEEKALILAATRVNLLGNRLVLIGKPPVPNVSLADVGSLAAALAGGHLAMALTDAVPVGIYGRQALEALGSWASVQRRIAQADNARAALMLVARGEARLGIVYASDALAEPGLKVLAEFPARLHDPVLYPVAQVAGSDHPHAAGFLKYLQQPAASAVFARHGFGPNTSLPP